MGNGVDLKRIDHLRETWTEKCHKDKNHLGFGADPRSSSICSNVVYQCAKIFRNQSQGKICFEKKCTDVTGVDDFEACVKTGQWMAAQKKWGRPTMAEVPPPPPKDDTVRLADTKSYEVIGVDKKKAKVYFVDENEDLVIVDGKALEGHPGFSVGSPEDFITKLSLSNRQPEIRKLNEGDKAVTPFLERWGLPTLEHIEPDKLVEYVKFVKTQMTILSAFASSENPAIEKMVSLYKNIIAKLGSSYLPGKSPDTWTDWRLQLPSRIIEILGERGFLLPFGMAYDLAERGDVANMEKAIKKFLEMKPEMASVVDKIRAIGYGRGIENIVNGLQRFVASGDGSALVLGQGIETIEKYLEESKFDSEEKLFSPNAAVYSRDGHDFSPSEILFTLDYVRAEYCLAMARELLAEAAEKNLSGENLEALFQKVRREPVEKARVPEDKKTEVMAQVEILISNYKSVSAGAIAIRIARHVKELASGEVGRDEIMDGSWQARIDTLVDEGEKALREASVVESDPAHAMLRASRKLAYVKAADEFAIAAVYSVRGGENDSTLNSLWYEYALNHYNKALELMKSDKIDGDARRISEIEQGIVLAHRTMFEQLLRYANAVVAKKNEPAWSGGKWQEEVNRIADRASNLVINAGLFDDEINRRIGQLFDEARAGDLNDNIRKLTDDVDRLLLPTLPIAHDNFHLRMTVQSVQVIMEKVQTVSADKSYARQALSELRRGYEKVYRNSLAKAYELFRASQDIITARDIGWRAKAEEWIVDAERYLNAKIDGGSDGEIAIFDGEYIGVQREEIKKYRMTFDNRELERGFATMRYISSDTQINETMWADRFSKLTIGMRKQIADFKASYPDGVPARSMYDLGGEIEICYSERIRHLKQIAKKLSTSKPEDWESQAYELLLEAKSLVLADEPGSDVPIFDGTVKEGESYSSTQKMMLSEIEMMRVEMGLPALESRPDSVQSLNGDKGVSN